MQLTNLAVNDHGGTFILQPLHCKIWCDTWNHYGGRYPELTGRIRCRHTGVSSCGNQRCQRLHIQTQQQGLR